VFASGERKQRQDGRVEVGFDRVEIASGQYALVSLYLHKNELPAMPFPGIDSPAAIPSDLLELFPTVCTLPIHTDRNAFCGIAFPRLAT